MQKKTASAEWKAILGKQIRKKILKGDYRSALPLATKAMKQYPDDVFCRYQYAKILGDWADELPPARKKKLKRDAVRILKPLTRCLSGVNSKDRFGICLNYYYQSENFSGMIRFGRRLASQGERQGYYAIGLGSSLQAMKDYQSKNFAQAKRSARRALIVWKIFNLKKEKYYFPHYIESMASAVLGDRASALRSLTQAAKLSKRRVNDWEFSDVYSILIGLESE